MKLEVQNLTKSLLQSNEVITTVLSEIQKGSQNSMLSLHNLIGALESKISLLLEKEEKKRAQQRIEDHRQMAMNSLDDIKEELESSENVLQDTHVFLKQAMDTLKNSSLRIKGLMSPRDEYHADENNFYRPHSISHNIDHNISHNIDHNISQNYEK